MGVMDKMMGAMMGRMSKEAKVDMMNKMMEKFFAELTAEDKQKMMAEMMPKMMEGVNMMDMMPKMMMDMMGGGEGEGGMMGMMPKMMMDMMPQCLSAMLPNLAKETRIDFVLKLVAILVEQGSVGMSSEEKEDFVAKVIQKVKA